MHFNCSPDVEVYLHLASGPTKAIYILQLAVQSYSHSQVLEYRHMTGEIV